MRAVAFDSSYISSSSTTFASSSTAFELSSTSSASPSNSSPLLQASSSVVSFLNSYCCISLASCFRASPKEDYHTQEKSLPSIEYSQPALTTFPALQTIPETHVHIREVGLGAYTIRKPRIRSKSSETMRSILATLRKQYRRPSKSGTSNTAGSSVRHLKISGPTDFRHVSAQSPLDPHIMVSPGPELMDAVEIVDSGESQEGIDGERPSSFHPLELSIHETSKEMSPILPHFYWPELPASVRLSGHHAGVVLDSTNDANFRAISFHVPRRPIVNTATVNPMLDTLGEDHDHMAPPIPPKSRKRAYTTPESKDMVERIASALIEKEKIEQAIEDCIERESIYMSSRPSTAMSSFEAKGLEPMPCVPALPPLAPSFSQRVRPSLQRPATAPSSSSSASPSLVASVSPIDSPITPATESYTATPNSPIVHIPLTPPLPLVLRPPLRKKQPFKRVSSWFFPDENLASMAQQEQSTQSQQAMVVTNSPMPVTNRDGFYQCLTPLTQRSTSATVGSRRQPIPSFDDDEDSSSVFSEWASEDDTTLQNTSTWSPTSALDMRRAGRFGSKHSTSTSNASGSAPICTELAYPVVGVAF